MGRPSWRKKDWLVKDLCDALNIFELSEFLSRITIRAGRLILLQIKFCVPESSSNIDRIYEPEFRVSHPALCRDLLDRGLSLLDRGGQLLGREETRFRFLAFIRLALGFLNTWLVGFRVPFRSFALIFLGIRPLRSWPRVRVCSPLLLCSSVCAGAPCSPRTPP